jgi:plasmid stability protein
MKQLITRIDEALHRRLKAKAAAEGRSVNDLVTEALEREVGTLSEREAFRRKLMRRGLLVVTPKPRGKMPTFEEMLESTRGWGTAVSEALEAERRSR